MKMAEAKNAAQAEEQKNAIKRNWADEDDDAQEDDDVEIGGSTVAQIGQASGANQAAQKEGEQPA